MTGVLHAVIIDQVSEKGATGCADYLRSAGPSFSTVYRRAVRLAAAQGWEVLPERTMRRRLDAEVSEMTRILAREGVEALKRRYPPQVTTSIVAGQPVQITSFTLTAGGA